MLEVGAEKTAVLILCRSSPFHFVGGMEVIAWETAKAILSTGHKVTYITTSVNGMPVEIIVDGIKVIFLPCESGVYSKKWDALCLRYFEENESSIHTVLSVSSAGFSIAKTVRRKNRNVRFIAQIHGTAISELKSAYFSKSLLRYILQGKIFSVFKDIGYRRFDIVVFCNKMHYQFSKTILGKLYFSSSETSFIENGVDASVFKYSDSTRTQSRYELKCSPETFVALIASRLCRQKGLQHAFQAIAAYSQINRNVLLIVAGEGPELSQLTILARKLSISDNVLFLGAIAHVRMNDLYCASYVLIVPSVRMESMPTNIIEAMSCNLPVIASKPLLPRAFRNVFGVKSASYKDIYRALLTIANSRIERRSVTPSEYGKDFYKLYASLFAR